MAARRDRVFALTILVIALLAIAARIVSRLPNEARPPLTVNELSQVARVVEHYTGQGLADTISNLFAGGDSASLREKIERKIPSDEAADLIVAVAEFQVGVFLLRPDPETPNGKMSLSFQYTKEGDDRRFSEIVEFGFDDSGNPIIAGGSGASEY